jgi:tRNA nucleotidyltransferase/poly(A) polymerase
LHEVTTFRRDVATDGRHAVVVYGVALEEDLARRDFTINAIAYHPLRREWRDPFGGAGDLDSRTIRAVGDPSERFGEDYLRILRALRFAARFDFDIDAQTWEAARVAAPGLAQLSAERVRDEWFKSLRTAASVTHLVSLWKGVGATQVWIPELEDAPIPAKIPPAGPGRDPVLLTSLLCSNATAVLKRFKASNAEVGRAQAIATGPESPEGTDEQSVRRWLSRVGQSAADLTALWSLRRGKEAPWAEAMRAIFSRGDALSRSDLAISGSDLEALGLSGPAIGQTLGHLLERVLADPTLNSRDRLLDFVRNRR